MKLSYNIVADPYELEMTRTHRMLEKLFWLKSSGGFPFSNIYLPTHNWIIIQLALAGYKKSFLEVAFDDVELSVSANHRSSTNFDSFSVDPLEQYLIGSADIKQSGFTKRWLLAQGMLPKYASFENGILQIVLEIDLSRSVIRHPGKLEIMDTSQIIVEEDSIRLAPKGESHASDCCASSKWC